MNEQDRNEQDREELNDANRQAFVNAQDIIELKQEMRKMQEALRKLENEE